MLSLYMIRVCLQPHVSVGTPDVLYAVEKERKRDNRKRGWNGKLEGVSERGMGPEKGDVNGREEGG